MLHADQIKEAQSKLNQCRGGLVAKLYVTLETPWPIACHAPLSVRYPRQEYRSSLPFLSPWDLPDPGIKPTSSALQVGSLTVTELIFKIFLRQWIL